MNVEEAMQYVKGRSSVLDSLALIVDRAADQSAAADAAAQGTAARSPERRNAAQLALCLETLRDAYAEVFGITPDAAERMFDRRLDQRQRQRAAERTPAR